MFFSFLILLSFFSYTRSKVLVNSVASCSLNEETNQAFCINAFARDIITFNHVDKIMMCSYHYCISFSDNTKQLSCSGYAFKTIKADYDTLKTQSSILVQSESALFQDDMLFRGYNLKTQGFQENVLSLYNSSIDTFNCGTSNGLQTCVKIYGQNEECSGLPGRFTIYYHYQSFLLALFFFAPFTFMISSLVLKYTSSSKCRQYTIITVILIITQTVTFVVIFNNTFSFVVKVFYFFFGNFVGIQLGLFSSSICCKKKKMTESTLTAEVQPINKDFEIDDDNDDHSDEGNQEQFKTIELKNI